MGITNLFLWNKKHPRAVSSLAALSLGLMLTAAPAAWAADDAANNAANDAAAGTAALPGAPALAAAAEAGAGTVVGIVVDATGAVIPGATVEIHNPVSALKRTARTDASGRFTFTNVPYNHYHLTASQTGFAATAQDVELHSSIVAQVTITLPVASAISTVTVEAGSDLVESEPVGHTDVNRELMDKLPLESASSSVSSLVTLASPGVSSDSNGQIHGMGDHAENSFSVDGQPITDQQSKMFSNAIPADSLQSIEVIPGAPPAEYGGKTSVVIVATTRSGQGVTTPHGSINASYGSFGTANVGFDVSYGSAKWGNFVAANGLNTGRFLDSPEFAVMHDKGNQQNFFDRVDYTLSDKDSLRLNFSLSRSWFQTPNSYDSEYATPWNGVVVDNGGLDPNGNLVGATDQRSKIVTFNVAPTWTHIVNGRTVANLGFFVRRDDYHYYPSGNAFADLGPQNLQQETIGQHRTLTNAGVRGDINYVKGAHNIKGGVTYTQTFLNEDFSLGIVDPTLLDSLSAADQSTLAPYDLTRGGTNYLFHGHTDVKELGMYVQDAITKGPWSANVGIRGDLYNGLVTATQAEPRLGLSYTVKSTGTVLRASYARTLESPYNENLVLSSEGCNYPVIAALIPCVSARNTPGYRNEFHAGLQQAFKNWVVVSGDYIWKYTHNAYDFSVLGATPIAFPIGWHNSKIPGYAVRVSMPEHHGLSALVVFSGVSARFFPPQTSGLGTTVGQSGQPFRIDHDEKFNSNVHLQYQPWKSGPWMGFNWHFDSGLVAGSVPYATDTTTPVGLSGLSAYQQMAAGLYCGSQRPTPGHPLASCAPAQYGSTLINIPAPGTENDDHNPPRIKPRSIFDLSLGDDNLFRSQDARRWSLTLTAVNLSNKYALYNFLSTFSGTHYVTPRSLTAQVAYHF
ncbi:MAG: TonB-dependent receptor [Acidobacteriota bacterium]|nr:TonB-dependent receptor [Acidobacteriota bacterium]